MDDIYYYDIENCGKEWSRIKEFNIVNTYSMKGCIIDEIIYILY